MSPTYRPELEALREPILAILRRSDLTSISAKKVRLALAETQDPQTPGQRLLTRLQIRLEDKEQKKQVDGVIRECFDTINAAADAATAAANGSGNGHVQTNGFVNSAPAQPSATPRIALPGMGGVPGSHTSEPKQEPGASSSSSPSTTTKNSSAKTTSGTGKRSRKNEDVFSDEEADLDAETLSQKTSGATKKSKPAKKRKSSAVDGEKAPPNPNNPFNKPVVLSDEMSKICGGKEMPRYMITKQLWAYIKERELQNPSNKRQIMCDPTLTALFGKDTVDSFEMAKLISKHVTKKDA